jgi:hypothetical protein
LLDAPLLAEPGVIQRTTDCGWKANGVALQHIIERAAVQRADGSLLSDCAGQEDKWNFWGDLAHDLKCLEAVELGQAEVGEDNVRMEARKCIAQLRFGLNPTDDAIKARRFELIQAEFGVGLNIFNLKKPNLLCWLFHMHIRRWLARVTPS